MPSRIGLRNLCLLGILTTAGSVGPLPGALSQTASRFQLDSSSEESVAEARVGESTGGVRGPRAARADLIPLRRPQANIRGISEAWEDPDPRYATSQLRAGPPREVFDDSRSAALRDPFAGLDLDDTRSKEVRTAQLNEIQPLGRTGTKGSAPLSVDPRAASESESRGASRRFVIPKRYLGDAPTFTNDSPGARDAGSPAVTLPLDPPGARSPATDLQTRTASFEAQAEVGEDPYQKVDESLAGSAKPNWWPLGLAMGLFASIAGNFFFGWVAWDTNARYQDLVDDLHESESRLEKNRLKSGGDAPRASRRRTDRAADDADEFSSRLASR